MFGAPKHFQLAANISVNSVSRPNGWMLVVVPLHKKFRKVVLSMKVKTHDCRLFIDNLRLEQSPQSFGRCSVFYVFVR